MGVCFGVLKHGVGVDVFVDGFVDRESLWCLLVSRDGSFVDLCSLVVSFL